ncbi:MAG: EFR1 family ferrodoxin [Candidatus Omnitrophica bacterium]|nr:EFR1 family ferrodoxin [Candidatus Omnitrophota bacterium]MDD5771764.1 EFR1 family ferrodoxin [Candidatus Omnitrophota bacterium]
MSLDLYYFSATGNCLAVARDIASEFEDARLIPITKALAVGIEQADAVGVVFPVYMFGLPLIVAEFLKALKLNPGTYVFTVATFGGLPGRAHSLARNILKSGGLKLSCGFSVIMPGNYTPLYGAISEEKQKEMFSREKIRVKEIAQFVRARKEGVFEESPVFTNFLFYSLFYRLGAKQIPSLSKGFWVTDACIKCGRCAGVCPVANIEMKDGRPVWLDHCQHCMACLQWCPVEAIQYAKTTVGRKRYRHPAVSEEDIKGQKA